MRWFPSPGLASGDRRGIDIRRRPLKAATCFGCRRAIDFKVRPDERRWATRGVLALSDGAGAIADGYVTIIVAATATHAVAITAPSRYARGFCITNRCAIGSSVSQYAAGARAARTKHHAGTFVPEK